MTASVQQIVAVTVIILLDFHMVPTLVSALQTFDQRHGTFSLSFIHSAYCVQGTVLGTSFKYELLSVGSILGQVTH